MKAVNFSTAADPGPPLTKFPSASRARAVTAKALPAVVEDAPAVISSPSYAPCVTVMAPVESVHTPALSARAMPVPTTSSRSVVPVPFAGTGAPTPPLSVQSAAMSREGFPYAS